MALVFGRISEPSADLRARFDQCQMNVFPPRFSKCAAISAPLAPPPMTAIERASVFIEAVVEGSIEPAPFMVGKFDKCILS